MSRTTHHTPSHHRDASRHEPGCPDGRWPLFIRECGCTRPTDAHTTRDLRYSRRVAAAAAATSARPIPEPTIHRLTHHTHWVRTYNVTAVGFYAALDESSARATARTALRHAVTAANAVLAHRTEVEDGLDPYEDLYDIDSPAPYRARHNAHWMAW